MQRNEATGLASVPCELSTTHTWQPLGTRSLNLPAASYTTLTRLSNHLTLVMFA